MNSLENKAWDRIETFLKEETFNGFTSDDLFIMNFIKKGWGQDIAALSNMAEAIVLRHRLGKLESSSAKSLINAVAYRAMHKSVSPYRQSIKSVNDLGKHGYYLEHLNIILGSAASLGISDYNDLNLRISVHLQEQSLMQKNAHAPLMPHVKMRWSADQAAILHSLWLCDKNHGTDFHKDPSDRWLDHMRLNMIHKETGLFQTEAMRVKQYSKQPRGCALSYLIHYASSFAPDVAQDQWRRYKEHMLIKKIGFLGFREYPETYEGKWTPDSGPIFMGIGVAATGLGLKAANSVADGETQNNLKRSIGGLLELCHATQHVPGLNMITAIGSDALASAIYSTSISGNGNST